MSHGHAPVVGIVLVIRLPSTMEGPSRGAGSAGPATAPVEWYQVVGAPHGGAKTIGGKDAFEIVFDFWGRVQNATQTEQLRVKAGLHWK